MSPVVYLGEVLEVKVSINLRRRDIRVAQQFLHATQVVAGLEQVGGERMPEQVRVDLGVDALAASPVIDARLHAAATKARAAVADEQGGLIEQIKRQQANGYQLAYVMEGGQVLCVAGFVISDKLAWQKHVYIDDLVTCEIQRSSGAGKYLLDWLKAYAKEQGCQQLHLDSGVQRFGAHKFYLREGFTISSHHFAITDLQDS